MFDGLYFYEIVLLILGVILFFTLLIILIIYTIQKRSPKVLLSFFILPIIMIGYSGYQKISFLNGLAELEKINRSLAKNSGDKTLAIQLKKVLSDVEGRPISDPKTYLEIAKGHTSIGDTLKALSSLDNAIILDSRIDEAIVLREQLNKPRFRVEKLSTELERNPEDQGLSNKLVQELSNLERTSKGNVAKIEQLAKSYAVLGDTVKVLSYADSLDKIDPNARTLTRNLRSRFIRKP